MPLPTSPPPPRGTDDKAKRMRDLLSSEPLSLPHPHSIQSRESLRGGDYTPGDHTASTSGDPSAYHQEKVPVPSFAFGWLDEKDKFSAGDVATIKVTVLRNYERDKYGYGFNPNVTVNGNMNIQASLDGMIEENPGVYESEIDNDGSILEGSILEGGKSFPVPCFLNKVFTKEVGEGGW